MGKLRSLLKDQEFSLIASLPANDLELVKAARDGGADGIKVHMNIFHRASGRSFGTLKENRGFFEKMHEIYHGVTGIVPGDAPEQVTREDVTALSKIGFDFISMYAHSAPACLLSNQEVEVMLAFSQHYARKDLQGANEFHVDVIEASCMAPESYGMPLTVADIWQYQHICQNVRAPVVVPTQKKVERTDLLLLKQAGVKAIMIGAVVTGTTPETVYETTKQFREAIDLMKEGKWA